MHEITSRDLRESLTLLLLERQDDKEGGWKEKWKPGPRLWASIWPLLGEKESPAYRVIICASLQLPQKVVFLWHLAHTSKRLSVANAPTLIQYNRFLSMYAKEDHHA